MNKESEFEIANETSRLLAELDRALNQSSLMREILRRHEQLQALESITGPSLKTRTLRNEIARLETRLRVERAAGDGPETSYSPA
jgi:hypothetical protein